MAAIVSTAAIAREAHWQHTTRGQGATATAKAGHDAMAAHFCYCCHSEADSLSYNFQKQEK